MFSSALNKHVDDFVSNEMAVATGGDFLLVHLRLEKVQARRRCCEDAWHACLWSAMRWSGGKEKGRDGATECFCHC